jgi:hypothetical protein
MLLHIVVLGADGLRIRRSRLLPNMALCLVVVLCLGQSGQKQEARSRE